MIDNLELYDGPVYYVEDAVTFIMKKTGVDEQTVRGVLDAEEDYMRSLGLIIE